MENISQTNKLFHQHGGNAPDTLLRQRRRRSSAGAPCFRSAAHMHLTALVFALLLTAGYLLGHVPMALLIAYGVMSAVAFLLYGLDKYAAIKGGERIAEKRLHLCALLGGWPGALLAQSLFRHKTRKRSFQIQFWLASLLNGGLLAALLVLR